MNEYKLDLSLSWRVHEGKVRCGWLVLSMHASIGSTEAGLEAVRAAICSDCSNQHQCVNSGVVTRSAGAEAMDEGWTCSITGFGNSLRHKHVTRYRFYMSKRQPV